MKEALYKIPLMDAFKSGDECPFCYIERDLEQKALDFVLGTSYMESDIREQTDKAGFCRYHTKKMYDYGNAQGNGLILKTHYMRLIREMKEQFASYSPVKTSLKEKLPIGNKKGFESLKEPVDPIAIWARKKDVSCYMCRYYEDSYIRYFETFFYLFKKEPEFTDLIKGCKGFCIHHLGELMELSRTNLSEKEGESLRNIVFPMMEENMDRVLEDVSWFCDKFDYRYKDADWKNSKDAVPRAMQKLRGLHPADAPYKQEK